MIRIPTDISSYVSYVSEGLAQPRTSESLRKSWLRVRQSELVMTVVKGGHGCRELVQSVMNVRHRIHQLVGLSGLSAPVFAKM